MTFTEQRTIAAISSAHGKAHRGIIRISGNNAFDVVNQYIDDQIDAKKHKWKTSNFFITSWQAKIPVILYIMKAPHSYTGEDTVEIHTFSSPVLLNIILEQLFILECYPALPGEFTKRSFLLGKMDLAQAEAVATMISAKTEQERKAAVLGITGKISKRILEIQDSAAFVVALMEAHIDFSDEEIDPLSADEISKHLQPIIDKLENFRKISEEVHTESIHVCLCGTTNAGKSTLVNILCGKECSIVSEISGTTLDFVEEKLELKNICFNIIDTPGIELYAEGIQIEAQRQSESILKNSDIILFVIDSSIPYNTLYEKITHYFQNSFVAIIYNKIDLASGITKDEIIDKTGIKTVFEMSQENISLVENIKEWFLSKIEKIQTNKNDILLNARQYHAVQQALKIINNCLCDLYEGISYEFIVGDMRLVLEYLGEIVGQVSTEDILDKVFSEFCIGK